jgi:hypothetical protein
MRTEIRKLSEQKKENKRGKERDVNNEYTAQSVNLFIKTRTECRKNTTRHKNKAE